MTTYDESAAPPAVTLLRVCLVFILLVVDDDGLQETRRCIQNNLKLIQTTVPSDPKTESMDILYSVCKEKQNSAPTSFLNCLKESRCLISVSNRNIIAFTSYTDLKDPSPKSSIVSVYVADLNVPNEVHYVTTHHEDITSLEWDFSATRLLIGDAMGGIQVHGLKDNLLRSWQELANMTVFYGEEVMFAAWFHTGVGVSVLSDKKDNHSIPWHEKFIWKKLSPSVKQFGGKASDGFMVISTSGLVYAHVVLGDGTVVTGTEVMGCFRSCLKAVDACYRKTGDFLVVTSDASIDSPINCYSVNVTVSNGNPDKIKCSILCQPLSSFFIDSEQDAEKWISHLKFVSKEDADAVLVTLSSNEGSSVELWDLTEKPVVLHKIFQNKKRNIESKPNTEDPKIEVEVGEEAMEEEPKIKEEPREAGDSIECQPKENKTVYVWQRQAIHVHSSQVASISTPKSSIIEGVSESLIAIAFTDNIIKCLNRQGLNEICSLSLCNLFSNRMSTDGAKSANKFSDKTVSHLTDMVLSSNGCALLGITSNAELVAFRITVVCETITPNSDHLKMSLSPQTLLEYCLITGNDWWDIQTCLKSSSIDSCFESLNSSFSKQHSSLQAKLFVRLQEMKGSLYRCLPATSSSSLGQVKAGDAHATIMLHSVATFLKSLLRARDNQEKEGPAENLSTLIQTKGKDFLNVDKVLMELEHKEFFVETIILQSLQNLNQWVADLTLYLLSSLPWQVHKHYRFPGGSLVSDAKSLNLLRELLVVIRIWGLINESCLPLFTRLNGDLDVIAHLFKMLTVRVGGIGSEVDESLLEECYRLPNQVLVNQPILALKARGITSPALYSNASINVVNNQQIPFTLYYFCEANKLKTSMKTHVIEGAVMYNLNRSMDIIRHVNLGRLDPTKHPNLRRCTRCQSVSQVNTNACRPTSIRAWDQRFSSRCLCGGSWQ